VIGFRDCLGLSNSIGRGARGGEKEKKYFRLQFGSRIFYDFLLSVGLTPAKSKTLRALRIPDAYFADFLRGCVDGDGNVHVYRHPESRRLQLCLRLSSGSLDFLQWLRVEIPRHFDVHGGVDS